MSAVLNPARSFTIWRVALVVWVASFLFLLGLYADTVFDMVGIWRRSETFAHAFLVPPITLWLVWRQRERLAQLTPRPEPWWLLAMVVFACVWLAADLVLVNAAAQFAWVALVVLSVPALLGVQVARVILFPLLFLFFAVPIGEFMTDPMMQWTADFTVTALRASGIPVYREGLRFVIPSGSWSVVEACSGIRYLIASFMVGTLFAYLNYRSWKRRAVFMLVALTVPIIANWLRAYMIVMLGHYSGNTLAVGADHLVYGWVFFGLVVMIMFMIGARWSEPDEPPVSSTAAPATSWGPTGAGASAVPVWLVGAGCLLVLLAPHAALGWLHKVEGGATPARLALPLTLVAPWQPVAPVSSYEPVFVKPAAQVRTAYAGPDGAVGLYIAYYRGQGEDGKLVSSVNTLVRSDDPDRHQVSADTVSVALSDGRAVQLRTASIQGVEATAGRREQLTAWRVYWVDGRWVAGDVAAKLAGAQTRLRGRGDDGAVLVLWTDGSSPSQAQALLDRFVRDNLDTVDAWLAQTRNQR